MSSKRRIEDNIKVDLWRIICEDGQWIYLLLCAIVCFLIGGVESYVRLQQCAREVVRPVLAIHCILFCHLRS